MDLKIKEEYLTTRQLRELFSISRPALMKIIRNNDIGKKKINIKGIHFRWVINTKDFIDYLEQFNK